MFELDVLVIAQQELVQHAILLHWSNIMQHAIYRALDCFDLQPYLRNSQDWYTYVSGLH